MNGLSSHASPFAGKHELLITLRTLRFSGDSYHPATDRDCYREREKPSQYDVWAVNYGMWVEIDLT